MGVKVREVTERWIKRENGTRERVKLKSPYFAVLIDYKGRRKFLKVEGGLRKAEAKAREIEAKLTADELKDGPPPVLFRDYAETFLERTETLRRPTTYSSYRGEIRNHLIPALGDFALGEITKAQVRELLISRIKKGAAPGSVRLLRTVLSAVLNAAVEDDHIRTNPAARAGKDLPKAPARDSFLTPESAEALLAALRADDKLSAAYLPVLLSLRAGLRIGEVLGLSWEDVDLGGKALTVRRTFTRGKEGPTKNGKERKIDMSGELEAALRLHRAATAAATLASGERSKWLFINPATERPHTEDWISDRLSKGLAAAKLPRMTFHALRHTFASHMRHLGAPAPLVRDLAGWADDSMMNRYSHTLPGGREMVCKLDKLGKRRKPAQTEKGA